ncbi:hypothetical protein BDP27DRAFT_1411608 [Rhodocollybia butyracea]|uniref:Uncharacterized protein n=1 Tax=Rhodocollybia butyracea TaxID=206335 RepID=A0A9P5P4D3_9AGAR|nr:hypothetical protein BDP27DRAFT_1411608 [Rhodocollybia butyracea]
MTTDRLMSRMLLFSGQRKNGKRQCQDSACRPCYRCAAASSQEQEITSRTNTASSRKQRGVDSSRFGAPVNAIPGRYNPASMSSYLSIPSLPQSQPNRVTFADGYNTSASPLDVHAELASPTKRSGRKSLGILKNDDRKKRERGFEDDDGEIAKKTRVEGDEFIDGDEEAEWQDSHPLQNSGSSRGSKRELGEDDDTIRRGRKRVEARDRDRFLVTKTEDRVGALRSISRGKKRDREEAGSSFGGDHGDEQEEEDFEIEEDKARRRKRRNKRRSDANSYRGKKRDRDLDDELEESDDASGRISRQILSKKKGKKASDDEKLSDVSMEDSPSASSRGRKIGETWSTNGVQYKIGPNESATKFVMPIDSVHPDRQANLEVYVEAWLSEEEYREAKAQQILSWQESPKASTEPETPPITAPATPTPARTGKHLLWDSTTSTPSTKPLDNPFETAKASASQQAVASAASSRRIASAARSNSASSKPPTPIPAGLADSTNIRSPRSYKQFSKWEKQDLEAKAMMRMREANRKKEEDNAQKEKEKLASLPAPVVPKITLTPAADNAEAKPPAFSLPGASTAPKPLFNAPATSSPLAAGGDNKADAAKPPASSGSSFSFGKPSPAPAATPTPASAVPSQVNSSTGASAKPSSFSFGPPAGASNNVPNNADKPPPAVGLGFPSTLSPASAPAPATTTAFGSSSVPVLPKFSSSSSKPAEQNKETPSGGASAGGGSLLSRMGGPAPIVQNNAPASLATSSSPFSKPPPSNVLSSSPFGQLLQLQVPFLISLHLRSCAGSTAPASSSTPSSLSGALTPVPTVPPTGQPTSSTFGFATAPKPAEVPSSTPAPPKFSFGAPAPAASTNNDSAPKPPSTHRNNDAPKSSFGGNNALNNAPNNTAPKSAFGFNAWRCYRASTSPFSKPSEGQSSEPTAAPKSAFSFAGSGAKPAGEPQVKSAFSFGSPNTSQPAAPAASSSSETPKSAFSFGTSSTPAGSPAKSAFSFGTAAPMSSASGNSFSFATPAGGQSAFGGASTPSTPNPFAAFAAKPASEPEMPK